MGFRVQRLLLGLTNRRFNEIGKEKEENARQGSNVKRAGRMKLIVQSA